MILALKIILIAILFIIVAAIALVILKGKGKPIKLVDKNGRPYANSISVREKITVNDSEQYMFITGEDRNKPVLLFLHGGPGSPEVALHRFEPGKRLEEKFVVCYWEQRGAGISYGAKLSPEKMTVDLMISDTIAVTEYLMKRFGQKRIYIMGHSWGSYLGIKVIQAKPEYYKAYFGIGQVAHQKLSERFAYEYMVEHANEMKDLKAVEEFRKFDINDPSFPTSKYILSTRTKYMNKYGIGIMHEENFKMSKVISNIFWFKGYTALDFLKYGLGNLSSVKAFNQIFTEENLILSDTNFEVPVYIFQGKYDYQVAHKVAKQYFEVITAPEKEFYTFENSAHSPNFEETEKFLKIVFSILEKYEN